MVIERQELYCHNCEKYVQFDLDLSENGKHVLKCPNCEHEHCRYVVDGKITDERWASRNGNIPTYTVSSYTASYSAQSVFDTYKSSTTCSYTAGFYYDSWSSGTTTSR